MDKQENSDAIPMNNGTSAIIAMMLGNAERTRAMMLSWVDEFERMLGYGDPDTGKGPRTAQIRGDYRNRGEPPLY